MLYNHFKQQRTTKSSILSSNYIDLNGNKRDENRKQVVFGHAGLVLMVTLTAQSELLSDNHLDRWGCEVLTASLFMWSNTSQRTALKTVAHWAESRWRGEKDVSVYHSKQSSTRFVREKLTTHKSEKRNRHRHWMVEKHEKDPTRKYDNVKPGIVARQQIKVANRHRGSLAGWVTALYYLSLPPMQSPYSRLLCVWKNFISKVFDRIPGEKGPHLLFPPHLIKHQHTRWQEN